MPTTLSHLAVIAVEGQQAETFLQGQLTCDLREVSPTQSRLAAYCNPKGRVIASCRVFKFQERYYLLLPTRQADSVIAQLQKFAVFSKIVLKNVSSNWVCLGYCGLLDSPSEVDQAAAFEDFLVIRVHGGTRFLLVGLSESSISLTLPSPASGRGEKCGFVDESQWQLLDIRSGIANIYPETSELFTPNMLGLAELGGVSFDKGCYVGQEIIARTRYLGKVKRTVQRFVLQSEQKPQAGDSVHNSQNQAVGTVVEAALAADQSYELLAVVPTEQNEDIFWNGCKLAPVSLELASS